jgi:CHAT domain-containing protein
MYRLHSNAFLTCVILLVCCIGLNAQSNDSTAARQLFEQAQSDYYYGNFESALVKARESRDIYQQFLSSDSDNYLDVSMLLARCYNFLEKFDSAFVCLDQSEQLIMSADILDSFRLATIYGLYSHVYDMSSQIDKSLEYGKKSLLWGKMMNPPHPKLGDFYHGMANVFFSMGDYTQSYDFYQRAVDFYSQTKALDDPSVLETRMAKSYVQILKGDVDGAIPEINELIAACQNKEESKTTLMALNSIMSSGLSRYGRYDEALSYSNRSLELMYEIFGKDHAYAADILQSQGEILKKLGRYDESADNFNRALIICRNSLGEQSSLTAAVYTSIADLLAEQGRYPEAYEKYDAALNSLNYSLTNPIHGVRHYKDILNALKGKTRTRIAAYNKNKDIKELNTNEYDQAINLIEDIRSVYQGTGSKEQLISQAYGLYENAIQRQHLLFDQSKDSTYMASAFQLIEKSKVQSLMEQLRAEVYEQHEQLRPEIFVTKDSLEEKMFRLRESIFRAGEQDITGKDSLNQLYLANKESYDNLLIELSQKYPEYYRFKYSQQTKDIASVQEELLDDSKAIISYFSGNEFVYTFLVTNESFHFNAMERSTLFDDIDKLKQDIIDQKQAGETVVKKLSDALISGIVEYIPETCNQLIIIPDGSIAYVPFELLNYSDKPDDFLIRHFQISYANSATLLAHQEKMSSKASKGFAGFAPEYDTDALNESDTSNDLLLANLVRSGNYNLPSAIEEVSGIADILNGDAYVGNEASESNFKKIAGDYGILHLAMHSMVNSKDPDYSRLLFDPESQEVEEDNNLHAMELRKLRLNADLAVLSACNTGYGQVQRGEGVLSIAHAFAYAGVPSTLMSLWEVPDQATSLIMLNFYRNLQDGQTKDEALRNAKLTYLDDESIHSALKTPFYWAGFIATGDMEPIQLNNDYGYIWFLIPVILLVIFFFWKRNWGI